MSKVLQLKKLPTAKYPQAKSSFDSDSLTSIFFPWQKQRQLPLYSSIQTGRTVSASEFYLFNASIMLLILALGLGGFSVWSIIFKILFNLLTGTSIELAYFALPSAILCLPCFWIVMSVHDDGKSHRFLSLVLILLTFSIVLMTIGIYIGFTHKLYLKRSQIEKKVELLKEFRGTLKKSMHNERIWDEMQEKFGCCGVDNYTDWFLISEKIPRSCCHKTTCRNNYTSSDGCLKKIMATLTLHTCLFNGINCVALFIQSCAFVVIACIYFCCKRKEED